MWTKLLLVTAIACGATAFSIGKGNVKDDDHDPEENMPTPDMIQYFGYPVETHTLTSGDGYIVDVHRIPYGLKSGPDDLPKTPVYLQHGLFCSSADWVVNFPYQSLGFMMADQGYDVWLGNFRGNVYGRKHQYLDPDADEEQFWHFSWDQMGEFDIPMIVDYVLQTTGYDQVYYAGHSMGTSAAMALFSTQPAYNDKVKLFAALAPIATLNHIKSPIKYFAPIANFVNLILQILGYGEWMPSDGLVNWLAQDCSAELEIFCENIVFVLCGYDVEELNQTRLDVYLTHTPAGTSTWTVVHYAQEIDAGRFRHCNWGTAENEQRYGQATPPDYDVTKMTVPTALFWGENDWLGDPQDVEILASQLDEAGVLQGSYQVGDDQWSHVDFVWGIDANTLLYPQVIALMPRY